MADNIVLHGKSQQTAARRLKFLAPFFIANTMFIIARVLGNVQAVPGNFQEWAGLLLGLFALPIPYVLLWASVNSERLCLKDGTVSNAGGDYPVSDLAVITGDVGSERDDFRDSIILRFTGGDEIVLYVEDYEEKELLAFIAGLKKANPEVVCTYSEIISLESRGLLRFLVSSVEPDNVILTLSKSPFEDTVLQLVKNHERAFWWLYSGLWMIAAVGMSVCSIIIEHERKTGVRVWDPTQTITELTKVVHSGNAVAHNPLDGISLQAWVWYKAALDYFTNAGVDFMTTAWLLIGVLALFFPIVRVLSPTFLFVDGNSMGMGIRFLPWDRARKVRLEHGSNMADSLEGHLHVEDDSGNDLSIDLRRVTDLKQRQLLLRLIDNYARNAKRNDEFMRTTNTLVDLQYTDIWLDSLRESNADTDRKETVPAGSTEQMRILADGKYEVERPLGFGGQGTAYLGRAAQPLVDKVDATTETMPTRQVVIKELVLPNFADVRVLQDATSRFERGASLLESLRHQQIVRLWDHFVENGRAYLILEYIEGKNLRQVVQETGAFSLKQVCEFGLQLCDILEYLHSQDPAVIHCDFAPDNLILTPGGKLRLVDFDVAQVLDARAYSFVAGRPSYTPPEQFRGQPTTQSDLFALGGILHYLLNATDPSPLGVVGDLDRDGSVSDFEQLVQDCLAFEMSARPASAAEVRSRLEQIVGGAAPDEGALRKNVDESSNGNGHDEDEGVVIKLTKAELAEVVAERAQEVSEKEHQIG